VARALKADQFDGEAHDLRATMAYDDGDYALAAAEGELAIKYRPRPAVTAYFTTVSAYVRLKDLARAETLAREGVSLLPYPVLKLQLAAILADRGDTVEALALVDAVLVDDPTNANAKVLRQALTAK
jgi:tetratricopeptide (TPR) repeat protein